MNHVKPLVGLACLFEGDIHLVAVNEADGKVARLSLNRRFH